MHPGVTASQDLQHTSYLGPILHHGYYTIFYFIRIVGYFSRHELNEVLTEYVGPPGFCVPKFAEYVEKGTKQTLPYTDGQASFHIVAGAPLDGALAHHVLDSICTQGVHMAY